eukprot:gene9182-biopygen1649
MTKSEAPHFFRAVRPAPYFPVSQAGAIFPCLLPHSPGRCIQRKLFLLRPFSWCSSRTSFLANCSRFSTGARKASLTFAPLQANIDCQFACTLFGIRGRWTGRHAVPPLRQQCATLCGRGAGRGRAVFFFAAPDIGRD